MLRDAVEALQNSDKYDVGICAVCRRSAVQEIKKCRIEIWDSLENIFDLDTVLEGGEEGMESDDDDD